MVKIFTRIPVICLCLLGGLVHAQSFTLPRPDHIIVLIEENQPNAFILGNSAAPYINQLAQDSIAAVFTRAYAIEHPSQPDYFDLFAGSNQGVLDDNVPVNYPFTTPNLARQLLDAGLSFTTYSQNLPSVGYDGASSNGYVRKHNQVANWVGNGTNQVPATTNQPFTAFPVINFDSLPTISYVVPVEDSDMHNGFGNPTIKAGDKWMSNNLTNLINWVKTHNALFIYTFDEDDGFAGNNIPTVFYGPMVKGGSYSDRITLYSLLKMMEDMYGLPYAGNAATAAAVPNVWRSTHTGIGTIDAEGIQIYPNPASNMLHINSSHDLTGAQLTITDLTGRTLGQYDMKGKELDLNVAPYDNGIYIYQLSQGAEVLRSARFSIMH